MAVSFIRGQQLGREDLNIFLTNSSGTPANAAEISYALIDFTTGQEVVIGPPRRTPANPSVGEYYASVLVPLDARVGSAGRSVSGSTRPFSRSSRSSTLLTAPPRTRAWLRIPTHRRP